MSAILSVLTSFLGPLSKAFVWLWKLVLKYPVVSILVLALAFVWWSKDHQVKEATAKYDKLKSETDKEKKEREARVQQIEKSSVATANQVEVSTNQTVSTINKLSYGYQSSITNAVKTKTLVQIVTKEIKSEDNVYREGDSVVCRKLPNEFVKSVNDMVKEANK